MSEGKKNKFKLPASSEGESPDDEKNDIEEKVTSKSKKSETAKEKVKEKKEKQKPEVTHSPSLMERWERLSAFYKNSKTQRILGLFLILISAYLSIAFISFIFTWEEDQDKILGPTTELFSPDTKVSNWLGKFGALVSHLFMFKWFGASSFLIVPIVLISGLKKLLNRNFDFLRKLSYSSLFFLLWLSLFFGFFFTDKLLFMGGGFGYILSQIINGYIGEAGTISLLVVVVLIYAVLAFNLSFEKKPKTVEDVLSESDEMTTEPIEEKRRNTLVSNFDGSEIEISPEEEAELMDIKLKEEESPMDEVELEIAKNVNEVDINSNIQEIEIINAKEEISISDDTFEQVSQNDGGEEEKKKEDGEVDFVVEETKEEEIIPVDEDKAKELVQQLGEYDPTLDLGSYQYPHYELLENYGNIETKINQEELNGNKNKIIDTLKNYGIEIDKIKATIGPTVTLYEIVPAAGVRISKIKNLEDDIALSLSALGIRIIAPIPGKGTIGIEVPNQQPEMVPMRNIIASDKFQHSNFDLPIALGKTISNETFIADLAKMPHLLMAGATGQGKSVGLNAILVSLLYKKHPAQIKFVLVDPKKVELTLFNKIERHFLAKLPNSEDAIITDNTKVIHTLNSLCIEMHNRYALLQDAMVRNIKEYNAKFISRKLNPNDGHKFLPYIVVVVDEFADLIMTAGKEVEAPIARLAQLARAIGIHLIIATQRPSVNIITGTIKANFPARIAFRVTSKIDSRTILDFGGAEQLIGRGDMLLSTGNDLIRIQCAFVDTPEVEKITEFIGSQRAYPSAFLLPEYIDETGGDGKDDIDLSERDKMFDEAARIVVQHQQGSASLLQRKLKLGYNRAGRIVDQLEAAGIIGAFEGSKAREVNIKDLNHLEQILENLRNK